MESQNNSYITTLCDVQRNTQSIREVFPEGVWLLIFVKLDSNSFHAAVNASLEFRKIVNAHPGKLANFLFPLAWPLLLKQICQPLTDMNDDCTSKSCLHDILKCRSVCQRWCKTVDASLQNKSKFYSSTDLAASTVRRLEAITTYSYFGRPQGQFLTHFQSTHEPDLGRSPFISGRVTFSGRREGIRQLPVARVYGKMITCCNVGGVLSYAGLCEILRHLPNLKFLTCILLFGATEEMKQSLLPHLPQLESLTFSLVNTPAELLAEVLDKFSNLKELDMTMECSKVDNFPPFVVNAQVKTLRTRIQEQGQLRVFELARSVETFCLHFDSFPFGVTPWPLFYVFRVLKDNIPESCQTLTHDLMDIRLIDECISARLELKSVRNLTLCLKNLIPLDFLLGMQQNLEYLWISVSTKEEKAQTEELPWMALIEEKEQVKFLSCTENMEASNIWELFPRLQFLEVKNNGKVLSWTRSNKFRRVERELASIDME